MPNFLTHPLHAEKPLLVRFDYEWNRTQRSISNGNTIKGVLSGMLVVSIFIGIVGTIMRGSQVFFIAGVVALVAFRFLVDCKNLLEKCEKKLEGNIFREVLMLPNKEGQPLLTEEKMEVFQNFGSRCVNLRIPSRWSYEADGKILSGYYFHDFFQWYSSHIKNLIEECEKKPSNVSLTKKHQYLTKTLVFLTETDKKYGNATVTHNLKDKSLDRLIFLLHQYVRLHAEGIKDHAKIEKEFLEILSEQPLGVIWKVSDVAKIISHCKEKLKAVSLPPTFQLKEIRGEEPGKSPHLLNLQVSDEETKITINQWQFETLEDVWNRRYGSLLPQLH